MRLSMRGLGKGRDGAQSDRGGRRPASGSLAPDARLECPPREIHRRDVMDSNGAPSLEELRMRREVLALTRLRFALVGSAIVLSIFGVPVEVVPR